MANNVDFFDLYRQKFNWKIIPLRPKSKTPCFSSWNKQYNPDLIRAYLKVNSSCNLGLILGDIIDVEGDTEQANERVEKIVGDYPHPIYRSEKSKHHLFLAPPQNITRIVIQDIEIRGNLHQSVLPPSVNFRGTKYSWLKNSSFPVPPMPKGLLNFIEQKLAESGFRKLVNVWCVKCGNQVQIHPKRHRDEVKGFSKFGHRWECAKCRKIDVRELCRKIRRNETIINVVNSAEKINDASKKLLVR